MSKILLIAINARFTHSNPALYYLRNFVEESNQEFEIEILELAIKQHIPEMVSAIYLKKPSAVFLSVYIWNSEIVRYLLLDLKKVLPECKIVLGGPEVSFNADEWLNNYNTIDYIITGAGETGFKYLLDNSLNVDERIIAKKNPVFAAIPFPYYQSDLAQLQGHYVYYEASRGCPFRCTYCLSSRSDQKLEFRELAQIEHELLFFINSELKIVKLVDRSFNARSEFSRHIWRFLIANYREGLTWHFEIYPDLLEDEDFAILATAPLDYFQLEIGIQSVNETTLRAVKRPEKWSSVKPKIQRLQSLRNMHIHVDLIAGLPFEDLMGFAASFDEVYSLQAEDFQLGFLKVLPGTEISDKLNEYEIKYSVKAPYSFYSTKWMSYADQLILFKVEFLLDRYANSGHFKVTEKELSAKFASPFAFYCKLVEYRDKIYPEYQVKEWEKNAAFLVDFNRETGLLDEVFLKDSLLWDWSANGQFNHRPPLLANQISDEMKKKPQEMLKELAKNGLLPEDRKEFLQKNLNKLTLLTPLNLDFQLKYLQGCNLGIVIRNGSGREIIPVNV